MSQGRTVEIADAVVTALNGHTFSLPMTCARQYLPRHALADLDTLQVTVVPQGVKSTLLTRGGDSENLHQIQIGLQQHVSDVNDATVVDPLTALVDEIQNFLLATTLYGASCIEVQSIIGNDALFAADHMTNDNVLTSVIAARFLE